MSREWRRDPSGGRTTSASNSAASPSSGPPERGTMTCGTLTTGAPRAGRWRTTGGVALEAGPLHLVASVP